MTAHFWRNLFRVIPAHWKSIVVIFCPTVSTTKIWMQQKQLLLWPMSHLRIVFKLDFHGYKPIRCQTVWIKPYLKTDESTQHSTNKLGINLNAWSENIWKLKFQISMHSSSQVYFARQGSSDSFSSYWGREATYLNTKEIFRYTWNETNHEPKWQFKE